MLDVVQGLWIGPALSALEGLSIRSFLAQGHEYHLYAYGPVAGVPAGARLMDAGEILDPSLIFQYRAYPSYAGFANQFRYRLLLQRGGWWADTDLICLRPLDFPEPYVFASETLPRGGTTPSNWLIKAPAGSEAMAFACEVCRAKDASLLRWGETGACLMRELIDRHGLAGFVRDPATFSPFPFDEWERSLLPAEAGGAAVLPPDTYTVHLWNEMWRRAGRDKDAVGPPDCLYERLKARYPSAATDGTGGGGRP